MKIIKSLLALALSPVIAAALYVYASFFWNFAVSSFPAYWTFWLGIAVYPLFQRLASRPTRLYVFEHEMTHALFAVLTGSRVKKISVKKDNGSVVVDKTNSLITLAPYFFPLFAFIVLAAWKIPARLWPAAVMPWAPLAHFVFGAALSFHFFMTARALLEGQSDLRSGGVFFSLAAIFFLYVCVSAFLLRFLFGSPSAFGDMREFFRSIWRLSAVFYEHLWKLFFDKALPEVRRLVSAPSAR